MLTFSLPLIPAETNRRLQIFHENLKTAEKLQTLDQGSAEYGVTKFSDLTGACACVLAPFQKRICNFQFACLHRLPSKDIPLNKVWVLSFCFLSFSFLEEEFRSTYLNALLSQWTLHKPMKPATPAKDPAPDSWDWRDHGAVSSVKNQVPAISAKAGTLNGMSHILLIPQWCVCVCLAGYVWVLLGIFSYRQHWRPVVSEKWDIAVSVWTRYTQQQQQTTSSTVDIPYPYPHISKHISWLHLQMHACDLMAWLFCFSQSLLTAMALIRLAEEGCHQTPTKPLRSWVGKMLNGKTINKHIRVQSEFFVYGCVVIL